MTLEVPVVKAPAWMTGLWAVVIGCWLRTDEVVLGVGDGTVVRAQAVRIPHPVTGSALTTVLGAPPAGESVARRGFLVDCVGGEYGSPPWIGLCRRENHWFIRSHTVHYGIRTLIALRDALVTLAKVAERHPGMDLRQVNLVDDADHGLRELGSGGPATAAHGPLVLDAIRAAVARYPDRCAVRYRSESWTYSEVWTRARRIAGGIQRLGLRPSDHVMLACDRSHLAVAAMIGCLLARTPYVPVDPRWPATRLADVVRLCGPGAILTDRDHLGWGPPELALVGAAAWRDGFVDEDRSAEDGAYVLFTSGTTGVPKGVQVSHGALTHMATEVNAVYRLGQRDLVLGLSPLHFDVSVWEVFGSLSVGAVLCIADDEERMDPRCLLALLQRHQVSVADLPPALMPMLDPDVLPDLRLVSVGGEAFPGSLVDRWASGGREFINSYGPTETTVIVSTMRCAAGWPKSPPIGRPLPGYRFRVLNDRLAMQPVGAVGELCISGPGLFSGYLGDPRQTAERLVTLAAGELAYRTGDLVRWRADGYLDYLGRLDRQVKVNGHRIELTEIESTVLGLSSVDACVVDVDRGPAGARLVCYVVTGGRAVGGLRREIAQLLPRYCVPEVFIEVPAIPTTPSGKTDREALRRIAGDRSAPTTGPGSGRLGRTYPSGIQRRGLP